MGQKDWKAIARRHQQTEEPPPKAPSSSMPTILVIEDEPPLQKFLRVTLTSHHYNVIEAMTGESGLRHAANDQPDVIILDLGLPDMDGMEIIKRVREWSGIPIIVVSARGKEQSKVIALDAGADDYLTKPFSVGELVARVRVMLRHLATAKQDTGTSVFVKDELQVDLSRREVTIAGKQVHLTPNEYRLLTILIKNAGKVMTHRQLLHEVWGPGSAEQSHYVRVYMNQLRQKLEPDPSRPKFFLTETGVGYRFVAQ